MNCQKVIDCMEDYLDDLLDTASRESIQRHFERCQECRERFAQDRYLRETLRSQPAPPADPDFASRVFERAAGKCRRRIYTSSLLKLAACILIFLTIGFVYRGVLRPGQSSGPEVSVVMNKPEKVRLVFYSAENLSNVTFTLELPSGIDIIGHENRRKISWQGKLDQGSNLLVLPVIVHNPDCNSIVAEIRHGELRRNFNLNFNVQQTGPDNLAPEGLESNTLPARAI